MAIDLVLIPLRPSHENFGERTLQTQLLLDWCLSGEIARIAVFTFILTKVLKMPVPTVKLCILLNKIEQGILERYIILSFKLFVNCFVNHAVCLFFISR